MQVEIKGESKNNTIPATSLEKNVLYVVQVEKDAPKVMRLRGCDNTMYGLGHGKRGIEPDDTWDTWMRADDPAHEGYYTAKRVAKLTVEVLEKLQQMVK